MTGGRVTNPNVENVSKSIGKLLEMVDREQPALPEMQRDFVWKRKSILLLIDSLYRGLPIGHMLVWKAKTTVEQKAFDKKRKPGVQLENFYGYLLDGQQRVTALGHLRDGDEDYPLMFYVWPERDKEGDDTFYWRGNKETDSPWCVPVAEVLEADFSPTRRLRYIQNDPYFKPEHEEKIREDLATLNAINDYKVGVTEFETDDYKLATELFIRFNSTGRKLRRSDLSIAELANRVPGLASNEIRKAQNRWKHFRFTMPFLVQCLLAVHTGRFRLSDPDHFWANVDESDLRKSWEKTERAIAVSVEFLTGTVRWTSGTLIPSFNALIPLVVVLAKGEKWSSEDRRLARRWLLLTCVRGYFSGAVDTQLDNVLRNIEKEPSVDRLWMSTKRRLQRLSSDDFLTGRISGPIMSLFLSMLRDSNARDWQNIDSPLDGTVVGHGSGIQIHHFFPRALLNKHKLSYADINTFANYTVLSASTNLDVSTEEPATYLRRLGVVAAELNKQCVPVDQELWHVGRYKEFLAQRRNLLAKQGNVFLGF